MNHVVSPDISDRAIERELQAKGLTALRVTLQHIDSLILKTYYHVPEGTTLTICVLTLKNGFNVVGESACVNPLNFDPLIGMTLAHENAKNKIWALEGYLLAERCAQPL